MVIGSHAQPPIGECGKWIPNDSTMENVYMDILGTMFKSKRTDAADINKIRKCHQTV